MSNPNHSEKSVYLDREEHIHKGSVGAKTVVMYTYNAGNDTLVPYTGNSQTTGQQTMAASNPVVIASNQSTLPVSDRGDAGTVAAVATSTTVATLRAAATTRKEIIIVNDSASNLFVKFGTAATSTDYTIKLATNQSLTDDKYTGTITGILDTGTGTARVTEVT